MKAIFVGDILAGDVIRLDDKTTLNVRGTLDAQQFPMDEVFVHVFAQDGRQLILKPGQIVGLVHRPWPKGENFAGLLTDIRIASVKLDKYRMRNAGNPPDDETARLIRNLCEALDTYELGRPLNTEQTKRDRQFIDRHMTP